MGPLEARNLKSESEWEMCDVRNGRLQHISMLRHVCIPESIHPSDWCRLSSPPKPLQSWNSASQPQPSYMNTWFYWVWVPKPTRKTPHFSTVCQVARLLCVCQSVCVCLCVWASFTVLKHPTGSSPSSAALEATELSETHSNEAPLWLFIPYKNTKLHY